MPPFQLLILLTYLLPHALTASLYCSRTRYGIPSFPDCRNLLATIPSTDAQTRLFVEQELQVLKSVGTSWGHVWDTRPPSQRESIAQVPKIWSLGSCNLALLSYVHAGSTVAISDSRWSDVFKAAAQLTGFCLGSNTQGGAAIVDDAAGTPALSIFLWQDGATFDALYNSYTQSVVPTWIDPTSLGGVSVANGSTLKWMGAGNRTVSL